MKSQGNNLPRVICRAWGDEPVALRLHVIEKNVCYVGKENSTKLVGLPAEQVFSFDSLRFSTLYAAFTHGDTEELRTLYANIPVEDFACNKYQDNLECLHDQEHIADPAGNASGHNE